MKTKQDEENRQETRYQRECREVSERVASMGPVPESAKKHPPLKLGAMLAGMGVSALWDAIQAAPTRSEQEQLIDQFNQKLKMAQQTGYLADVKPLEKGKPLPAEVFPPTS